MRVALGIEYDGARYFGWQRQNDAISVQQQLEKALKVVADTEIQVQCAGRTDAGVHATGQVVHFDSPVVRPDVAWTLGLNTHLPADVAIKWVKNVEDDFHARFSATARRYRYIIYNNRLRTGILNRGITHVYIPLDHEKMHQAAQCLLGEHDFSAFRASLCQAKTATRRLSHINITRTGDYIMIDVQANAFLHHMVRNITGSLVKIGTGERPVGWLNELLLNKDRTKAAATAKPNGLYLVKVVYPDSFAIPNPPLGPLML